MLTLLNKEIWSFFSSLIGYIVILFFLISTSMILWIFPGDYNILDSGYATLETLFFIAPWVFLFLVPAITMRMFSEERKAGTIEMLFTKPLTEMQVVFAKYIASVLLVLFSLLPALVSFLSVYWLGNPVGNIDTGGTWGSFIGLFFLAAIYAAIGIFSSSLTDNQIVAFLVAMIISFFFYTGFDSISGLFGAKLQEIIIYFGIDSHYRSMSRGVIDTRDVIYFVGVILLFLFSTKTILESRKW